MERENTKAFSQNCVDFAFSTQQLHRNEIKLDKHHEHEKFQVSESCKRSCSFFNVLHFLFLALMARLASVGLISKIPVLNVSTNRQEFIVFVQQSDNIANMSIQRGESPFDPSTSSSQSSRLSQISCFRADKSIAKRLLSTCLLLGETKCAKRLSQICQPDISHLMQKLFPPIREY